MSSIVKLNIQGIRSFGIKTEDKQSITFSSPLTLILGANGCGKTTIIECLKYALTGELPPGSDRGKSFVHDPKIFDAIECLGQVQLQIKNIHGQYLTVTRSVKISQQKRGRGDPSFTALPPTITIGNNENETISKRVADVDNELTQFMGVSKAIINNVIFCHQENASWPLDEPKKLKEKFDAIFGTTKYDKAIGKMINIKKCQESLLRDKSKDLDFAKMRKQETDSKTLDLENLIQKKETLEKICENLKGDLTPIQERLDTIHKCELEMGKYQAKKIKLKTEIGNCKDQISSIRSKIKKEFDGGIPQLDREILNFHEKMKVKKSELQNLEDLLKLLKNQGSKIQDSLTDLEGKGRFLTHKRQQEQEYLSQRAKSINKLCEGFQIPVTFNFETAQDKEIQKILKKIENSFALEKEKIDELLKSHDKIDSEKQIEIDKCRGNEITIESEIQSKEIEKTKQEKELQKIKVEINNNETNAKKLSSITADVEKVDSMLKSFEDKANFEQRKKEIESKKLEIKKKNEIFRKLDDKLTFLNSISKKIAEIHLKEKELQKREQEIKKFKNRHADKLKAIFPNQNIESNYKRKCQDAYDEIQKTIKEFQEKENQYSLKLKGLEIERRNKKDQINKWEKEKEENSDKIFDKCRGNPFPEVLARAKENVEKYQLELGALRSSESMFKKYIKNIEEDPCCPLCNNSLSNNKVAEMTSDMTEKIRNVPCNISKTEQLLRKEHTNYEAIMSLKPMIEKNEKLEKDIPQYKENLKHIENQLIELNNEIKSLQALIVEPSSNIELVNSMLGDMALLDEAVKDVYEIKNDLKTLKDKLPGNKESSNIDEIQIEKATISAEIENERNDLEKQQADYDFQMTSFNELREKRAYLKDNQIKLQEDIQSLPQLKIRAEEITKNLNKLSMETEKLKFNLKPLKLKLEELIKEKSILKSRNRNIFNEANSKLDNLKKINHEIERSNRELKNLAEENLQENIDNIIKTCKQIKNEQDLNSKKNSDTTAKIEIIKSEISNQELLERDLNDNRELKILQQKEIKLKEESEDLQNEIGDLNFENISKERNSLIEKRESLTDERGKILGQLGEIKLQIDKLQCELKDPKFKDSLKNYRKLFYEVKILEQVIHDLNQYNFALDFALSQYHTEKMRKINRLIREFWRQIYRGNDIDFIEIKTDHDDSNTAAVNKRRTFNYSVIQSKNNTKIEMRGRCSAGQRVLASLIIRMALAETFSSNCGVLALDEPTTNLDRNNIISLCETLVRIVEERKSQSNFMLLIITHDEDFISQLGKITNYHKVSRNSEGKSIIRKTVVA